jgi:hypothetical protein
MATNWLDVTAVGEVVLEKGRAILRVEGADAVFELKEDPGAKVNGRTAFAVLREAVERGQKKVSVTGRVDGWKGHFPPFLKTLPKKPRVLLVKEFSAAK